MEKESLNEIVVESEDGSERGCCRGWRNDNLLNVEATANISSFLVTIYRLDMEAHPPKREEVKLFTVDREKGYEINYGLEFTIEIPEVYVGADYFVNLSPNWMMGIPKSYPHLSFSLCEEEDGT